MYYNIFPERHKKHDNSVMTQILEMQSIIKNTDLFVFIRIDMKKEEWIYF